MHEVSLSTVDRSVQFLPSESWSLRLAFFFFFFSLYNTLTFYVYIGRLGLKQWFTAGFCGTTLKTRRNMSKPWYVFAFEVVGWKYHHRLMLRALFHWRRLGFILCHKKKKKKKWGKFSLFLSENFYLDLNTHY